MPTGLHLRIRRAAVAVLAQLAETLLRQPWQDQAGQD
jgi:hypothetical protein